MKINPKKIYGEWKVGWALDNHTESSKYSTKENKFETQRTEIGEALYQLKYRENKSYIEPIANVVIEFMKTLLVAPYIKVIIPIPPSDINREFQPVYEIAKKISQKNNIPFDFAYLKKKKQIPQLKDIETFEERTKILQDAFTVEDEKYKNQKILLFDDLYRSGATMNEVSKVLLKQGKVNNVYAITLTKTRIKK